MPDLEIIVNGRPYTIRCNDGEEAHVTRLAGELDARAKQLRHGVGPIDEARLLVMVALILADELHEVRSVPPSAAIPAAAVDADGMARAIDVLAARIEAVAARLRAA